MCSHWIYSIYHEPRAPSAQFSCRNGPSPSGVVLPRFRFEPRWPRVDPWPEPLWPEPAVRVRWGSDVVQVGGQQFFEKAWPALTRFDPDPNLEPLQPECQHGRRTIELIFCTCSGSSSKNPCLGSLTCIFWLYITYTLEFLVCCCCSDWWICHKVVGKCT